MKSKTLKWLIVAIPLCLLVFGMTTAYVQAGDEYSFKVSNTSRTTIKKILVSENKSTWGEFDVGSGIRGGDTATLVWDASTNNEACKQWVKAVYSDGSETEPAKFNFCEKGLELEF